MPLHEDRGRVTTGSAASKPSTPRIIKTLALRAPPAAVWHALTDPDAMRQWMGEPQMQIEILTDWVVNGPIVVRGLHNGSFENRGTVLCFEPGRRLRYTHLSSVSRLPDHPDNHTVIDFALAPSADGTLLTVTLDNFPTESIFKHFDFYWRVTPQILQRFIERG